MYHSEPSYSRAGLGVVFRDADSSAKALQELAHKRQERAERKRAAILMGILVLMALSVHLTTMRPNHSSKANNAKGRKGSGGANAIDYGDGSGRGGGSMLSSGNNSTRQPTVLDNFVDATLSAPGTAFTPFFFHVPRSGGQTVKEIAGLCFSKIQASEVGIRQGHGSDTQLQLVTIDDSQYVNVDTTTQKGIQRAAMMGFSQTPMADLVTSSYFLHAGKYLFAQDRPGRSFIMMRHPIERAVSMYHYRKSTGEIAEGVTMEDYGRGNGIENNWMTRFLTNVLEGELKKSHLDQAKIILSKKFLVGFLDDAQESIARFIKYNDWQYDPQDETKALQQKDCVARKLQEGSNRNPVEYEMPKKTSQAHALIAWQVGYDQKLYDFAKQLFELQTNQYGTKERKKELKKKQQKAQKGK